MNFVFKPLELLLRQLGVGNFIALLSALLVVAGAVSIATQSWQFTLAWAIGVNLLSIFCFILFRTELAALMSLISHASANPDKTEALAASEGLFADIERPLLTMLRELFRKQNSFDDIVREMKHSATELSNNVSLLSRNTVEQSESTNSTAAAVTEIGQSIEEVTTRIKEVLEAADLVRNYGVEGESSLANAQQAVGDVANLARETQSQVNQLADESKAVTTMSKDIADIADQTNLLALNAAIEAARAGEHGRGFSVVADEVRALAERSQKSATFISEKIENVNACMSQVENSMSNVLMYVEKCMSETESAGTKLREIASSSDDVSKQISAIATASEQQSIAAKEISSHIERVAMNAEENSYMAKQTAEVSQYLVAIATNKSIN